ncbi:MAG: sulfite exporter TauE/SafE family protein [Bacteroidaceae bacterium]|nr:sulfite exporter TauE/SafE family protein [Bacteroidaceae bacterium]
MMDTTLLFIFFLTIVASFIQRVSGFGFGIFVMMFFPFFLPSYGESITLSGLLAGTTALLIAMRNFKHIRWSLMWIIVLFNVVVSYIAIEYMASVSNEVLKRCLGVLLVIIALYFMLCDGKIKMVIRSRLSQSVVGALSGWMGGMFAMPGPPVVLYCINAIGDKREYIATLQAFSVVFNIFYTIFRANVGFFGEDTLFYWAVGLMGLVVGAWLGSRCFEYISRSLLKKIVYVMMIISGCVAIF